MKEIEKAVKATDDIINIFTSAFDQKTQVTEDAIFKSITNQIRKLDTDANGHIVISNANLKKLRTVRGSISKTVLTDSYLSDVNSFLHAFEELESVNAAYYAAIAETQSISNPLYLQEIKMFSIESTKASLTEAGLNIEIIAPIEKVLTQAVTSGADYSTFFDQLKEMIVGVDKNGGSMKKYTSQILKDSLGQFNASYNEAISSDLGLTYYYYSGSIKETTRTYCSDLIIKGRFFHKEEIKKSASKSWAGKIPNTNESNIFIYRGGFNCRHQWLAVGDDFVPKDVKDNAKKKGYV